MPPELKSPSTFDAGGGPGEAEWDLSAPDVSDAHLNTASREMLPCNFLHLNYRPVLLSNLARNDTRLFVAAQKCKR